VQRLLQSETRIPQRLQELLHEPHAVHGLRRPVDEQRKDVGVLVREPPERPVPLPDAFLPILIAQRNLQLAQQNLHHPIEQRALVRDVVVERHRLYPELRSQLPHR
jgi:hypothetical protein